jgi:hypothetical protein
MMTNCASCRIDLRYLVQSTVPVLRVHHEQEPCWQNWMAVTGDGRVAAYSSTCFREYVAVLVTLMDTTVLYYDQRCMYFFV